MQKNNIKNNLPLYGIFLLLITPTLTIKTGTNIKPS